MGLDKSGDHTDLEPNKALWVRKNIHDLEKLPAPSEEWKLREVDIGQSLHAKLRDKGLIDRLDRKEGTKTYTYRTKRVTFEAIQEFLRREEKSDSLLPCGHNGFVNQGDVLECKRCGTPHDKSEVSA